METTWSEFKKFVQDREISVQYVEANGNYHLKAFDSYFSLECVLSISEENSDTVDFETNFKTTGNKKLEKRNFDGYVVSAPTFEDAQGLTTVWKGHLYTAQPASLNIYDEVVTTQLRLRGGWYKILSTGANIGDYVEFSIVDKDNILGLFAYFGLTVGEDVLELKKFVITEYINPISLERQDFVSGGASEVMAGLYFRIYYYNSGLTPVKFSVTEKYHEN